MFDRWSRALERFRAAPRNDDAISEALLLRSEALAPYGEALVAEAPSSRHSDV